MTFMPKDQTVFGMTQTQFRTVFVVGPLLSASIVPSLLFGIIAGQWGSNLIWGSLFGLGWCLAAFASGNIVHDSFSTNVGVVWGWLALVPLYYWSGWLWRTLDDRKRRAAVALLLLSFLLVVPAKTLMNWEEHGLHFPDYSLHLATSY